MTYSDVLRVRPFRNLWLGQSISQIGDSLYYVAFMFMVKKVTGSAAMVGYTGALELAPYLLIGPYAGVIADRVDRRMIMLASDLLSALALLLFSAVILAVATPPVWSILLLAFLLSAVRCFFLPAKSAAIPALIPPDLLMRANSLSSATQTLMPVIGLSLSATVLAALYYLSPQWFFLGIVTVNALSFLGSAWFVALLPPVMPDRSDTRNVHPFADFLEGMRYVKRRHDLKVLIALLTVFRFSVAPFFVAYVVANDLWWGGPKHQGKPQTLALLELVFFAAMVLSSLAMGRFVVKHPAKWFCYGLASVGLAVMFMAWSPQIWLYCIWNFLAGLAVPAADIPINTYCQLSVEDAFRGRTNSVLSMIANTSAVFGNALGGMFVARFGLSTAFLAMGIGMALACVAGLLDARFRNVKMPAVS
ncbi:MAG: MFS transporter [Fimbriimonadaceae bacterium]